MGKGLAPLAWAVPAPGVPVVVFVLTVAETPEFEGDKARVLDKEERDEAPEVPPAAGDSSANPIEGGFERKTE